MNLQINRKKIAAALSLATLVLAAPAFADHGSGQYRKASSVSGYANNSRAQYDYARVLSADPIINYVTVSTPVQECYQDVEYYTVNNRPAGTRASTLVGAIVGGVIGNQFGGGRGNDAATVAGTLIGAAVGNDAARQRHAGYTQTRYSRPVERCSTVVRERQEKRIDGYNVVYTYNGQKYATRMPYDPGRELRIRVDIRPAA
jgi:uncharacterized protein YcfJ